MSRSYLILHVSGVERANNELRVWHWPLALVPGYFCEPYLNGASSCFPKTRDDLMQLERFFATYHASHIEY